MARKASGQQTKKTPSVDPKLLSKLTEKQLANAQFIVDLSHFMVDNMRVLGTNAVMDGLMMYLCGECLRTSAPDKAAEDLLNGFGYHFSKMQQNKDFLKMIASKKKTKTQGE